MNEHERLSTEEKMSIVQESKALTEAVALLVAAFKDCNLKSFIRMSWSVGDTENGEIYEMTFLKKHDAPITSTNPEIETL